MTEQLAASDWKTFENAVADFLQALDPSARVLRDVQTLDTDTGLPRQRDVWIETTFGGHFPMKILVSCKRTKSKINQQHMDAFIGELLASGAGQGVLYSAAGFIKGAIEKARKRGISCCSLLENRSADLPGILSFNAYLFSRADAFWIVGRSRRRCIDDQRTV